MNFARFQPRAMVLVMLGALALAALLAGGCAAPDSDERARFGVVTGVVVDASNTPIAGAQVTVASPFATRTLGGPIGTLNYFGDRGPFVTDASGRFTITGVKLSDTEAGLTVLNLVATAPGFIPSTATVAAPRTTTILGRAFVAGAQTTDIVVQNEVTTGVVARLTRPGETVAVGAAGATLTPAITDTASGASLGTATVTIPAGALTQTANLAVTGVVGSSLATIAAAPPATIPTATTPANPASNVVAGTGTVAVTVPLAGLDIRSLTGDSVTFATGSPATVSVPLPAGLTVTGANLAVIRFNPLSGQWELVPGPVTVSGGNASFNIPGTGTYALVVPATWQFGTATATGQKVEFPPVASAPNGYIVSGRISNSLAFGAGTMENFLLTGFSSLTGQPANAPVLVVVPAGTTTGRLATESRFPITVTIGSQTFTGTRTQWTVTDFTLPVQPTFPSHLQGHVQGGASGS